MGSGNRVAAVAGLAVMLVGLAVASDYCQAQLPQLQSVPFGGQGSLQRVAVVTRHGDRSPINLLPYDDAEWDCSIEEILGEGFPVPNNDQYAYGEITIQQIIIPATQPYQSRFWNGNCTPGQLTLKGAQQHWNLGTALRQIYVDKLKFLPEMFDSEQIYIRSTDVWRTKQSVASCFTALYPPEYRNKGEIFQIHTVPSYADSLSPNGGMCPHYSTALASLQASPAYQAKQQQYQAVRSRIESVCGTAGNPTFLGATDKYMDIFRGRVCNGMNLPCDKTKTNCVSQQDFLATVQQAEWENALYANDLATAHGAMGQFVSELGQFLVNGYTGKELWGHFSSHDSSLSYILGLLGVYTDWPPYASNLIFELWTDPTGAKFVRVMFNGQIQTVLGCSDSLCPLAEFLQTVDSRATIHNYQAECFSTSSQDFPVFCFYHPRNN